MLSSLYVRRQPSGLALFPNQLVIPVVHDPHSLTSLAASASEQREGRAVHIPTVVDIS